MPEKTSDDVSFAVRESYEKAVAAFKKRNYDYAVTLLCNLLRQEPAYYEAREALRACQHARATGRTSFFKRLVGSATALTKGQMALRSNPYDAIAMAEDTLNDEPAHVGAHELLARGALAVGLPKTALLSLEIAHKHKGDDRDISLLLAQAARASGNQARAEKVYRDLLRNNPSDPELNEQLKNLLAERTLNEGGYGALEGGGGSYRDVLKDKEEARTLEQAARTVKDEDVAGRLIAEYEAKLPSDPNPIRLMRELADLYLKKKDFDRAVDYLEKSLAAGGVNDPRVLEAIRNAHIAKFDHTEQLLDKTSPDFEERLAVLKAERDAWRLEETRKRVDLNPTDLHIRYELGELLLQANRIGEAIAELQKAQNNPNRRVPAMCLLARAFARRGMNDLAARKLQEALAEKQVFDEETKEIRYQLGCVLDAMGKKADAIEHFKAIYERDIGFRDVMDRVDAFYASGDTPPT
jgi:tetratricopeptide (TPR) repeat protein